MNTTLNWAEVASTTGSLVNDAYPFLTLYTGLYIALLAAAGIIVIVIRAVKRNIF